MLCAAERARLSRVQLARTALCAGRPEARLPDRSTCSELRPGHQIEAIPKVPCQTAQPRPNGVDAGNGAVARHTAP